MPPKQSAGLFGSKKLTREERILVHVLREQHLSDIRSALRERDGVEPTGSEVEVAFELFIAESRRNGLWQRMLDKYLELKIASARAAFGR